MGAEIIIIIALILSIVLHEVAHGYAANWLGDPTARLSGRLTLNPLPHIDLLGSIIVPALLFITHAGFLFGWAKPVPYNPYNLKNQRWGEAIVAAAGPLTNMLLAVIFAILIRLSGTFGLTGSFVSLAGYIVFINLILAVLNLIPIPPLDGSKVLMAILPVGGAMKYRALIMKMEQLGMIFMFVFIFLFITVLWGPFSIFLSWLFMLLTGLHGF
jgi:Zn-dependent protease